jgi:hypothetical protein
LPIEPVVHADRRGLDREPDGVGIRQGAGRTKQSSTRSSGGKIHILGSEIQVVIFGKSAADTAPIPSITLIVTVAENVNFEFIMCAPALISMNFRKWTHFRRHAQKIARGSII